MDSVKYKMKLIDEDVVALWLTAGNVIYLRFINRLEIDGGNEK